MALVVVVLLVSCNNKEIMRQTEPIYTPRYAEGFSIERDKASGEVLLSVKNPWQGAENIIYHYPIDTLNPVKRIVTMSSSYAAMLDAVGCSDRIVGLSGCRFVYSSDLCKKIAGGKISEVGYDSNLDFETIRSLRADIVLLYGVASEAKQITNKLDELRIPYMYIGEYLENNPLGKAEWVVALAYLCGVGEQGKAFFKGVEERYNALRNQKHCSAYRPRVMLNLPYRDTWFMPPKGSYMVQLIEDAGGEYILKTRDERRETREGEQQTRDERRETREGEQQTRDERRETRENNQQTRDERRETREGEQQTRDERRETREGEQQTRDERRETREGEQQTRVNTDCKQNNTTNCQLSIVNCQLKNADMNNNTSTPISLEEALVLALQADFWINLGQIASKEELQRAVPRFAKVDAVRFGRIYNNTKRTNESRGSDFWESGCIRPDLILADLVKILHYEAPTDSLHYYKKME